MTTEPRNEGHAPTRISSGHAKRPQSSLAGLKPFLLAGLLVVIGLLVGLNFLLGGAGVSSAPNAEPVPGAMTIGPPPGGFSLKRGEQAERKAMRSAPSPGPSTAGGAPVAPSEFTFYETLKKQSHDPVGTVGLTPSNAPSPAPVPSKSTTAAAPPKSAAPSQAGPPPLHTAAPKPTPAKNPVIDTTTAKNSGLRYTIQVAAFGQQSMAEQMIKELSKKGHDAYLATGSSSNGVTYRVRIGRFATREEADRTAKQLATKERLHPFIATVEPGSLQRG